MGQNVSFQEIWDKLKSCKKIAMTLHNAPDGDSVGSCTALKYVLERDFKAEVSLVSYDPVSESFMNLPYIHEVQFGKDISDLDLSSFDAVIFLDGAYPGFFSGKLRNNFSIPESAFTICVDHHPGNTYFSSLAYVDTTSCSTCSLLLELFRSQNVKIDVNLANLLLLGICTDGGFFTFDTNPHQAVCDAAFLIEHGADYLNGVLKPIFYDQPLRLKKYFALLINNLKANQMYRCGHSIISYTDVKKLGLNEVEVRLGINELQFIKEFDFVFTLAEMKDHLKGSFRSKKGVDVSLFAKELGGGGHKPAAAFILPLMPLGEAEEKVIAAIEKVKKSQKLEKNL